MKTIFAVCVALILSACGKTEQHIPPTIPQMERISTVPNVGPETTPILFNGQKYLITFTGRDGAGGGFIVFDWSGNVVSSIFAPGMATGSAIVKDGTVYVFGTTGVTVHGTYTHGSQFIMSSSADLFNWTPAVVVYQAPPNVGLGNSSVTATPDGFVMAYDFDQPGLVGYSYRFLFSTDLVNWAPIGGTFRPDYYTSCPSIRWLDGQYYLFFLDKAKREDYTAYFTRLARTSDLDVFEVQTAPYAVVSPAEDEGVATTDLDLVEEAGQTYFIYSAGDQLTWGEEHIAKFNGTLSDFVKLFF